MSREEATKIKGEILEKEGEVKVGNTITISGVVLLEDILKIIDNHIGKENNYNDSENNDTEIWHGIHGQVVAPKGTFEKIWNDAEDDYEI